MDCSCSNEIKYKNSIISETSSIWSFSDYLSSAKMRMSIGRNSSSVKPGLYNLGKPDENSDVVVSANYKLSFDILRKNLFGLNVWILVLDTKGVNVWCAAGKGTFGTTELITKLSQTNLKNVVNHKRLIVPQLGAPGIASYQVKKSTGFKVMYGPVMAQDIKKFISSGYKASEKERTIRFSWKDRLTLAPVEVINSSKYLLAALISINILLGFKIENNSIALSLDHLYESTLILITAYLSGALITPILLPWIPSRYFAAKGMIVGAITFFVLFLVQLISSNLVILFGWLLVAMAISSFLALNFTGASTYTSLSGVKKEMRIFIPIQIGLSVTGLSIVLFTNLFFP